jgi:hypothetical protein
MAKCRDHLPKETLHREDIERHKQASFFEERRRGCCIGRSERKFGENCYWTREQQKTGKGSRFDACES